MYACPDPPSSMYIYILCINLMHNKCPKHTNARVIDPMFLLHFFAFVLKMIHRESIKGERSASRIWNDSWRIHVYTFFMFFWWSILRKNMPPLLFFLVGFTLWSTGAFSDSGADVGLGNFEKVGCGCGGVQRLKNY